MASETPPAKDTILRLPDVLARVGLGRASIYRLIAQGSFPRPIALSERARGWRESTISAWIESRAGATPQQSQ